MRISQVILLKAFLLVFLFGISLDKVVAQDFHVEHTIKGCVIDHESGDTIPFAKVCLYSTDSLVKWGEAGVNGCFDLKTGSHGEMNLQVSYFGYRTVRYPVKFNRQKVFDEPIKLKTDDYVLPPIDIGFTRPDDHKEMTGTGSTVNEEKLEVTKPIGTGEALAEIPGILVAGDDGFGNSRLSVGIRGLNPRRSAKTLVLEDGIPIQPNAYVYPNVYYNPPIERIKQIEVIKGSGAIKYGPQTMGGVINYITAYPSDTLAGTTVMTAGMNGYLSAYHQVSGFGNENYQPEIQVLYKKGDGYRRFNNFNQYNLTYKAHHQINKDKKLYFKVNYNDEYANATYSGLTEYAYELDPLFNVKEHDEFTISRLAGDLIFKNTTQDSLVGVTKVYANYFNREWWREDDAFIAASSLATYYNNPDLEIGTGAGDILEVNPYSQIDKVRVGNRTSNFGILRQFYVVGVEQNYDYKHSLFGKKSELSFGAKYHLERFINKTRIGDSPTDRVGALWVEELNTTTNELERVALSGAIAKNYETWATAGFLQEAVWLSSSLKVEGGVRIEHFKQSEVNLLNGGTLKDKVSTVVLPGLGLNLEVSEESNVFAGIHRGYTPPSSGTFAVFSAVQIDESLDDFLPEFSWNYEAGYRTTSKYFYNESSLFYLDISNIKTPARNYLFINPGRAATMGFESAGKLKLHNCKTGWKSYLPDFFYTYTYLHTVIKEGEISIVDINQSSVDNGETKVIDLKGNQLSYAPTHTLFFGVQKEIGKMTTNVTLQYVSSSFSDLENYTQEDLDNYASYFTGRGDAGPIPSYTLLNASFFYRHSNSWEFGINAKNLLDRVYLASRLHSSPSKTSAGQSSGLIVGPRRQVNLSLTHKF